MPSFMGKQVSDHNNIFTASPSFALLVSLGLGLGLSLSISLSLSLFLSPIANLVKTVKFLAKNFHNKFEVIIHLVILNNKVTT